MAMIISIALQKGGAGKSTTAQALASTLGFKGKRTLLIDLDGQANVTYASGVDNPTHTITDVLSGTVQASDAVIRCRRYDLLAADGYLYNVERVETLSGTLLKDSIHPLVNNYDYIIIDTPPSLGNLLFNALVASDYVIIPADPRTYTVRQILALNATINDVRQINPPLGVLGILLVKFSTRTILARDMKDDLEKCAKLLGTSLFESTIREGIAVAEAQAMRMPLIDYAKNSKPNIDYKGFTTEVLQRVGDF